LAQWCIDLFDDQYNVVGVDNCFRYGKLNKHRSYAFEEGDLCNREWIDSIIVKHQPQYILHCAAHIYGIIGFQKYSADIITNNLISTANLADVAVKRNVEKIAYISSSMVYENANTFPLKETFTESIPMPNTGYGVSKLVGEKILQAYHQQYGLKYVVWRPFNIVTPYERSDREPGIAHVFADFIQKIIIDSQCEIEIFGNGSQTRCFTWIDDMAKIIAAKSFDSITDNEIYNLGSESPTRIIELAEKIFKKSKRTDLFNPKFVKIDYDDVKNRVPDSSKAKSIGFCNTKTLDQMIDCCINEII
jgi:nucleoside-diphosphate-sugar epimerase